MCNANRRRAHIPLQLYYYNRTINPKREISIEGYVFRYYAIR